MPQAQRRVGSFFPRIGFLCLLATVFCVPAESLPAESRSLDRDDTDGERKERSQRVRERDDEEKKKKKKKKRTSKERDEKSRKRKAREKDQDRDESDSSKKKRRSKREERERRSKKKRGSSSRTVVARARLAKLVELNARSLFGGKAKIEDGRVTITFDDKGQITRGFEGQGVHDSDSEMIQGSNRKFILHGDQKDGEKLYPGLTAIGLGRGQWTSRFPLKGKTWLEFGFRLPNLIGGQSQFSAIVNWDPKKKSGYETQFFNTITRISGGQRRGKQLTPIKEYRRSPRHWFPRRGDSTRIAFGVRDDTCRVEMASKGLVEAPLPEDRGGYVRFQFNKIVFTLDNLVISGEIDEEWAKAELDRLDERGELRTKEAPEGEAEPGGGESAPEPADGDAEEDEDL